MTGRYSPDRLYEEVAFVAYHFNWSHDTVLELPHDERARWCAEISRINERMNADHESGGRASTGGTELADLAEAGDGPVDRTGRTGPPTRTGTGTETTDPSELTADANRPDEGPEERDE